MKSGQKRDGGVEKKPSRCPNDDGIIIRSFRIEDYDAVTTLWRRTEGRGAERIRHTPSHHRVSATQSAFQFRCGAGWPDHWRRVVRPRRPARLPASSGGGKTLSEAGHRPATGECLSDETPQDRHLQMQHLHLRQQCGGHEVLDAHRLEATNGIAADANSSG